MTLKTFNLIDLHLRPHKYSGAIYECRAGETLCEIVWTDPVPVSEPELLDLFQRAETAIDIYTADSQEVGQ